MRILLVEDDCLVHRSMQLTFPEDEIVIAETANEAIEKLGRIPFNIMFLDIRLRGDQTGIDVLKKARTIDPILPIIVVSGIEDRKTIMECFELGAVDYLVKGTVTQAAYYTAVHKASAWRKKLSEHSQEKSPPARTTDPLESIKGISKSVTDLKEELRRVGKTDGPFLILGETGTGKELVAKALWSMMRDENRPYITVNCAELQTTMIEGELFGYEKGAFTGANNSRTGLFEAAHGGDIFLDEIGELPLEFQAKFLRVLQEKTVRRIGSNSEKQFDFRVIVATNRNLASEVSEGRFREDLFFRLNVHSISLCPLRNRKEDIPGLLRWYFEKAGMREVTFDSDVDSEIKAFNWPGNIRQLTAFVSFAVPFLDSVKPNLGQDIWERWLKKSSGIVSRIAEVFPSVKDQLISFVKDGNFNIDSYSENIRREFVRAALDLGKFNRNEAARILGITRQRLAYWIETLNV